MDGDLLKGAAGAALGLVTCWVLIPCLLLAARRFGLAGPATEFHHTHTTPVPRLGGLALVAAFVLVAALAAVLYPAGPPPKNIRWTLVLGSLGMFGLGFWDDLRKLDAKTKLLGQIALALAVYWGGVQIQWLKNPLTNTPYALGAASVVVTVFWLVALTNLINLIDGIDGLAAGISLMLMCLLANLGLGLGLSFTTLLTVGVAGALVGFLRYNFPPANVFLGDGGAYFLGFLIGQLAIVNSHKGSVAAALIAPMLALGLPILDVVLTLARRAVRGLPLFRPDQQHLHHRLLRLGLSRRRALLVLYGISVWCSVAAFAAFWLQGRLLPLLCGCVCVGLIGVGRLLGWNNEWQAGRQRSDSPLHWRRESRYALTLAQWLEMEADRRECLFELWQDFQFVAKKLGFSEVKLCLDGVTQLWRAAGIQGDLGPVHRQRHQLSTGTLELAAHDRVMPRPLFDLLTELAAEAWQKAARRWQHMHDAPLRFDAVSSDTSLFRQVGRRYEPVRQAWWIPKRELQPQPARLRVG